MTGNRQEYAAACEALGRSMKHTRGYATFLLLFSVLSS